MKKKKRKFWVTRDAGTSYVTLWLTEPKLNGDEWLDGKFICDLLSIDFVALFGKEPPRCRRKIVLEI